MTPDMNVRNRHAQDIVVKDEVLRPILKTLAVHSLSALHSNYLMFSPCVPQRNSLSLLPTAVTHTTKSPPHCVRYATTTLL